MKRKLTIIFSLTAVLALLTGGTWAYFTTQASTENTITTGSVHLKIHQRTADGREVAGQEELVMPGDTVSRIVTVENTGEQPVYLRVRLTKGVQGQELSAEECMGFVVNTSAWTPRDGYYYYNEVLPAGAETPSLIDEIYFEGMAIDNAYLGRDFTLNVEAYGVQAANNGESVLDALGWPEEATEQE